MRGDTAVGGRAALIKYRAIIIAIVGFLICDFSVMTLNLYSSRQARQYAVHINFARQFSTLTQEVSRILSEMLIIEAAQDTPDPQLLSDLRAGQRQFDALLAAFSDGGTVTDEAGNAFVIQPLTSPAAREHLATLARQWTDLREGITKVTDAAHYGPEELGLAQTYAVTYRDQMLAVTGLVVSDAQAQSDQATRRLQVAQVVGFSLAMVNFIYTILMSMRSLIRNDRRIAIAQRQTDEILSTVREGLFLLDRDLRIGERYSASMHELFQQDLRPGADFLAILGRMASAATLESARDYVEVLFGEHVMEDLVESLNPLAEVEVRTADPDHGERVRHLSFRFNRVVEHGRISHLLVTVQDASARVRLAAELQAASTRARADLEVYLRLLGKDVQQLGRFLSATQERLSAINARLRLAAERGSDNHADVVHWTFRNIHSIKGDAGALGLDLFESLAHRLEDELAALRSRGDLRGDDMIRIAVRLDEFFDKLGVLSEIAGRMAQISPRPAASADRRSAAIAAALRTLTENVATGQGKRVRALIDVEAVDGVSPELAAALQDIAVQLLRNAVAHGIEHPEERLRAGKPARGTIHVACHRDGGQLELSVRDDGGGIQLERVRASLLRSGHTPEQVQGLSPRDTVMKLFEPGFSTRDAADADAGRGVGLDVVQERARAIGGRLRLSSLPNHYTEFSLSIETAQVPA